MDGISAAASILGIATAGIQISIKLITFSNQVGTAPSRIRNIGNDVSLTSGVLQQLGDLMKAKISDDDDKTSIFSPSGLESTKASAEACNGIFHDLKHALERASKQIRTNSENLGGKVVLSTVERLKWPFLQPGFDDLRADLRESRETLMLILQVTTLAYSKKLAELNVPAALDPDEQSEMINAILAMQKFNVASNPVRDEQPERLIEEQDEPNPSDDEQSWKSSFSPSLETEISRNPERGTQTDPIKPVGLVAKTSHDTGGSSESTKNTDSTMEAWIVVPNIIRVFKGHDLRWQVNILPLQQEEVIKQLRRMQRWKRSNVSEQMSALGDAEREAINSYITDSSMNSQQITSQVFLLAVSRKKIRLQNESADVGSYHCIYVIAKREDLQNQNYSQKKTRARKMQHSMTQMNLPRPTYIKVHQKHLSPETLDAYQLPWERDNNDPNYFIIKRWIPEKDRDILFEHTKALRMSNPERLKPSNDKLFLVRKKSSPNRKVKFRPWLEDEGPEGEGPEDEVPEDRMPSSTRFGSHVNYSMPCSSNIDMEETPEKIVNDLLEKYTTLFSKTESSTAASPQVDVQT